MQYSTIDLSSAQPFTTADAGRGYTKRQPISTVAASSTVRQHSPTIVSITHHNPGQLKQADASPSSGQPATQLLRVRAQYMRQYSAVLLY